MCACTFVLHVHVCVFVETTCVIRLLIHVHVQCTCISACTCTSMPITWYINALISVGHIQYYLTTPIHHVHSFLLGDHILKTQTLPLYKL